MKKKIINEFLSQIVIFQNQFNLYIEILKHKLKRTLELQCGLINNLKQNKFSNIDIENVKTIVNNKSLENINDNAKKFVDCQTFMKKYEYLKNIFELFLKRGKYIEELNIKDKYNKLKNEYILPLNDDYLLTYYKETIKIMKKIKNLSNPYCFDYLTIFDKTLDFTISDIILKNNNKNVEKKIIFYILKKKKHDIYMKLN